MIDILRSLSFLSFFFFLVCMYEPRLDAMAGSEWDDLVLVISILGMAVLDLSYLGSEMGF